MLPSTAVQFGLPVPFDLRNYKSYSLRDWHVRVDGAVHISYGAPIQSQKSDGSMTIRGSTLPRETTLAIRLAVAVISGDQVSTAQLASPVQVIFIPLLFRRGWKPRGMRIAEIFGGDEADGDLGGDVVGIPNVIGVSIVSGSQSKRRSPRTYWNKFGLYTATACTLKPLDWKDGILVGERYPETNSNPDETLNVEEEVTDNIEIRHSWFRNFVDVFTKLFQA